MSYPTPNDDNSSWLLDEPQGVWLGQGRGKRSKSSHKLSHGVTMGLRRSVIPLKYRFMGLFPRWMGGRPLYESVASTRCINDHSLYAFLSMELAQAQHSGRAVDVKQIEEWMEVVRWRIGRDTSARTRP